MISLFFPKPLKDKLRSLLTVARQTNDYRLYRLTQGLLWMAENRGMGEIARLFNVSRSTPYNWLKSFLRKGLNWVLKGAYSRQGRPAKLTKSQKKQLYKMIESGPECNGFDSGVWNTAMINELIFRQFGVRYNPRYLSSVLKKMGLSYQKAGFITDRTDEAEHEKARQKWLEVTWPAILKQAQKDRAVILFGDEVSFALWGSLSRTWAPVGNSP